MKKALTLIFILFAYAIAGLAQSQALEGVIEDIVAPYINENGTRGLTVGIIESGHTYQYSFGQTGENDINLPDVNKLYPIGSSSKIFTAAILMQMVGEEKIDLAEPISNLLPYKFENPAARKLNPHLLASHQSGLPMRPQNFHLSKKDPEHPFAHYTDSLSYEYLSIYRESKKNYPIGKFRFSNYNYVVVGEALCYSSKLSWLELFDMYIKQNYALDGCSADLPLNEELLAPVHSITGKELLPNKYGVFAPTTGVYANLPTSLQFMQVWIDAVNASEWNQIQECLMEHSETDRKHVQAGYGWFIYPRTKKKPPVYTVSGKTNGSWSFYGMIPKTKTAVVILSNSKHSVDNLGIEILDLINR